LRRFKAYIMHRQFRQRSVNQVKGASAIGFLVALLMLSGCAGQGAAAGPNAARSSAAPATTAVTKAAVARPPATRAGPATGMTIIHTVQQGENLYRIARTYGTSVQAIAQANGIADVTHITVGQKIAIPDFPATTEPEPTATPTATSGHAYLGRVYGNSQRSDRDDRSQHNADRDAHAVAYAAAAG
jgi:LysM repeat protein